ncbi:MAG: SEL1-like repeat protein [Verrucomicrobiota bacterium]
MNHLLKLLPIIAVAAVIFFNRDGVKKNFDVVGKVQAAATSNVELEAIADAVSMEFLESEKLPLQNFSAFLKEHMMEGKGQSKRDLSADMWGTPYAIARLKDGFEIRSAGPDKAWETDDDLKHFRTLKGLPAMDAEMASAPKAKASAPPPAMVRTPAAPTQTAEETLRKVIASQRARAEAGYATSQYDLGMRYLTGDGVELNLAEGRKWIEKAAGNGHSLAIQKLNQLNAGK